MNKTQQLHELGQRLWIDNITREILDDGTLRSYSDEVSITGLTSTPTIFDEAIGKTGAYDKGIREKAKTGKSGEPLFMELALEDLRRAADLFRPIFDATDGIDGWVSMEVSPLLANDTIDFVVGVGPDGNFNFDSTGLAATIGPVPVPEPASLTLLALTAAGAAGYAWRRQRMV